MKADLTQLVISFCSLKQYLSASNHPKFFFAKQTILIILITCAKVSDTQGCALAEPGGPWRLTFALGRLENHRFFIQIIRWAP